MENHNHLADLRQAENVTAAEFAYRPVEHGGNRQANAKLSGPSEVPNVYETPVLRSRTPYPAAKKSTDDLFHHQDQRDDVEPVESNDGKEADTIKAQRPDDIAGAQIQKTSKSLVPPQSSNDTSHPRTRRESDLLLQMIPYRPSFLRPLRSDYLLTDGPIPESCTESVTQEATNSIRLLLDRWTTAGSGLVSSTLDQEAAKDKDVDERTWERRAALHLQYEPGAWAAPHPDFELDDEDTRYHELDPYAESVQVHQPAPGMVPQRVDYWKYPYMSSRARGLRLRHDMLDSLRSAKGGIHYIEESPVRQDHYVDERPVYFNSILPPDLVSRPDRECATAEIGSGMVRKEALDLMGYTYTETPTGRLSISGDISFVSSIERFADPDGQLTLA
ncbi:MAG: hypothetical protein Q9183_007205 [Haloplaca sp. 2 TL-2023]